jgi:hypothetical protein
MGRHLRRILLGTAGISAPYWTVIFATVLIPLASLSMDVPRALYVRMHLQAANDAACEAAAQALDIPKFQKTGTAEIDPGLARSYALREFNGTLRDQGVVDYKPSFAGLRLLSPRTAGCRATAILTRFVPATPPMIIEVYTEAEMRVQSKR